ncbi:hypothetical protein [Kitasatospora sp. NPDC059827]|uniref:hypothetical protein n=1 Tax=Kitasatospora sp. NPDC059827 TaxID=3346964 RepID=UPI003664FB45
MDARLSDDDGMSWGVLSDHWCLPMCWLEVRLRVLDHATRAVVTSLLRSAITRPSVTTGRPSCPDCSDSGVPHTITPGGTPPELLPVVFAEFHRVLAPGGHLLIASKAGDEHRRLENAYGHELSLDVYWVPPDRISELLSQTGLAVDARLIREPNESERPQQGQQAYLLARKPGQPTTPRETNPPICSGDNI